MLLLSPVDEVSSHLAPPHNYGITRTFKIVGFPEDASQGARASRAAAADSVGPTGRLFRPGAEESRSKALGESAIQGDTPFRVPGLGGRADALDKSKGC